MRHAILPLTLGILLCALVPLTAADTPGGTTTPAAQPPLALVELLDKLAEKGILTPEECAVLKQRAAEAEKSTPAMPAPVSAAKPAYPTVQTKMRLQARWSSVQQDDGQPNFGERDDQTGGDGFAVRRARLCLYGQLNPKAGYTVQYQADNGTEDANLHVAQLEWKGWDFANLVAGQLQTPGGYEIVLCDANFLLTDRAAFSLMIPPDKDMGIRLDSKRPSFGKLNYQLFVGNGSSKYKGLGESGGYLWMGRVSTKPSPELTIAATYSRNNDTDYSSYQARFLKKNGDPYKLLSSYTAAAVDETHWGADFQYERHPVSVWGEYAAARIAPCGKKSITTSGSYLDAGYFIPYRGRQDRVQLVAGFQQFDANADVADKYDMSAWTLGVNYHIAPKFQHMVRAYYMWVNEKRDPVENDKLVLQYQLWF